MTRKPERRKRRRGAPVLLLLLLLLALLLADNFLIRVREYDLTFPDLPPGFSGLRVLQLSDLHGRSDLTGQLLRRAEAAGPDLIFITGDLADGEGQLERLEPLLAGLTALAPVYYVTGNHEWALEDTEDFLAALAGQGVRVLRNAFDTLERDGGSLIVAGLEDPNGYADMKSPAALASEIREAGGGFSLLLAHRPEHFGEYASLGFRLVFSGHVHGGMVRIPFLGGLLAPGHVLFPRYDGGLFALDGSRMILSRGLAGVGGFPRILNPVEISLAVLTRE